MRSSKEAFRSEVKNRLGLAQLANQAGTASSVSMMGRNGRWHLSSSPAWILPAFELIHQGVEPKAGPTVVKVGADWDKERAIEPCGGA